MSTALTEAVNGVAATIRALNLTGIAGTTHVVSMVVADTQGGQGTKIPGYPCIICWPTAPEYEQGGTNVRDTWVYPVGVAMFAQEPDKELSTTIERNRLWRQTIKRAFHQKRLAGVTAGVAWKCEVKPGTAADIPRWMNGEHGQLLIVNVFILEPGR